MHDIVIPAKDYTIPRYRVPDDVSWYHVLHGNVPRHQIDFMYCPEVPQGALTPTHFSHLSRLMKYIEPQAWAPHAFAIGNLSRDDTQHEPGRGAVSIIIGVRIGGAADHAGRHSPPFAHAILAADRNLTCATLLEAAATFHRRLMNASEAHSFIGDFYDDYVRTILERSEHVSRLLAGYVHQFGDLPRLRRSESAWDWVAEEDAQPKRVVIAHDDDEVFGNIALAGARIAALLFRSNIRWTSITTGRERDIPGGVSIRLAAERDVTDDDRRGILVRLDDLPEHEAELAHILFGASSREELEHRRPRGWRERYGTQVETGGDPLSASEINPPVQGEHGTAIMQLCPQDLAVLRGQRSVSDVVEVAPNASVERHVNSLGSGLPSIGKSAGVNADGPRTFRTALLWASVGIACSAVAVAILFIFSSAPGGWAPQQQTVAPAVAPEIAANAVGSALPAPREGTSSLSAPKAPPVISSGITSRPATNDGLAISTKTRLDRATHGRANGKKVRTTPSQCGALGETLCLSR